MDAALNLSYIKRDVYRDMLAWKNSLVSMKTSLEVEGARQVGKSFIVKRFAEENFKKVYFVDLLDRDDRRKAEKIVEQALGLDDTMKFFFPGFFDSSDAVVVIDEVQEFANMYNLIKPFALKMKTHLIVTGSFLGKALNSGFFHAGAERTGIVVRSLSFPEFLGIFENGRVREIYESIDLFGGSPREHYVRLERYYNLYLTIGGYPLVVRKALESGKLDAAFTEIREVVQAFCQDSQNYLEDITDVEALPLLLKQIAVFLLADQRGNLNFSDELQKIDYGSITRKKAVMNAMSWLTKSQLISPCGRIIDLSPSVELSYARYYFTDVGLANHLYQLTGINQSNRTGRLAENFVYSCFLEKRLIGDNYPSFATYGDTELDFLLFVPDGANTRKVAIEVKTHHKKGQSSSELLSNGKIDYLINVRAGTMGGRAGNILTIPIYLFGRFDTEMIIEKAVDPAQEILTSLVENSM